MRKIYLGIGLVSLALAGCESGPVTGDDSDILDHKARRNKELGNLFGDDIFTFGNSKKSSAEATGITVNEYLWRASLDTISFMPLRSVDPFGGVILTEWYTPDSNKNERLKVDVFILDKQLKANGVRVAIHKQVFNAQTKQWNDKVVDPSSINELEEAILTRARQLKVKNKV